jgi:anti-sigma-K factor RskA
MSNPENNSDFKEMAALHALGLLDDAGRAELLEAARHDAEIDRLIVNFDEAAALLAYEAPEVQPPPGLRQKILQQLPERGSSSKIIPFHPWLPYAIAACLMALGILQALQIGTLKSQLVNESANVKRLSASNALIGLRLQTLEAKDTSYSSSQIMVAWDPYQHRGVVALQNLPAPPAGHDYQLWVLDPSAPAPISAGLITASRPFAVQPVSTESPGFAISLEPTGGRPEPTGPILFAVAPGP